MALDEKMYGLVLAAAGVGTWHWTIATNEVIWSANTEALFGLEKGQFDGIYASFIALLPDEDRQRLSAAIHQTLEHDAPYEIEHRVVWPNGETHWYLGKGSIVRDGTGHPLEMLGTTQDITARKKTELALVESETRFRTVVTAMAAGLTVQDHNDRILSGNPAAEEILGLTCGQLPASSATCGAEYGCAHR